MCESYARSVLRVAVAQMCQALGWDSVQLSACELISDLLERYLLQLARSTHRYSTLYGRTDPGLSDVEQAFGLMGVNVAELEDYINNLEPVSFFHPIPQFPISKSSMLQFPISSFDADARNALLGDKRDYIPDYLPPLAPLHQDEEEEQVPPDMGTSAEAMQVSLDEEEEGEDEENDENWLGTRSSDSPRPEGLLPAAKRPRLSSKPGASPEWSFEPREPLSSLNAQHMPRSPSPPLPPLPHEMVRPTVTPPTPGHKPKVSSLSPARQKNKSPKRGIGTTPSAVSGRIITLNTPKRPLKPGKRSPGWPKSPKSPRPGPANLGCGWPASHVEDISLGGELKDEAIEDSIAAVIAKACSGGSDPFAYDSDSDSDGFAKSPPKHTSKHTLMPTKLPQPLMMKNIPLPPASLLPPTPNRWTLDDSIDEVIRKANQSQPVPRQSPPALPQFSSPSLSPPTPPLPSLNPPQERKDPVTSKKIKKDIKTKLKKKDRERLKEKGKDKGKNKEKNKEKKRDKDKERGQGDDGKPLWPDILLGLEERRDIAGGKKDKDKHKDKKKDKEKSKKDKEKRDKSKERALKEERKLVLVNKDPSSISVPLFSTPTCGRTPSMLPALQPILPEKLFSPKESKSKEKEKKKDKKEKKKKKDKEKERDKDKDRERPKEKDRDKEEKKKEKEKDKKEKVKEKEKEKPKVEKPSLMVEPPAVPQSPVIPRLTLRVGVGQDKIVISKASSELEPTPPPPRIPIARTGPGARMRSLPPPPPPTPPPIPPAPRPPPVLLPPPPPPVPPPVVNQAKARGCSVVTETVSAYVIRDEWGNQIWICPGCNKPDDGSPMIGCDECDDWYHWLCVGIVAAPPEDQQWYCVKCNGKKKDKKTKKRKRKAH